jgi:hypothetical protein
VIVAVLRRGQLWVAMRSRFSTDRCIISTGTTGQARRDQHLLGDVGPVAVVGHVALGVPDRLDLPAMDVAEEGAVRAADAPLEETVGDDLGHRVADLVRTHVGMSPSGALSMSKVSPTAVNGLASGLPPTCPSCRYRRGRGLETIWNSLLAGVAMRLVADIRSEDTWFSIG